MSFIVTLTPENIHSYPQHVHDTAEITCYLEGAGVMKTERGENENWRASWGLGYSDPLYFSKLFKKTYGCPLSSFLKAEGK